MEFNNSKLFNNNLNIMSKSDNKIDNKLSKSNNRNEGIEATKEVEDTLTLERKSPHVASKIELNSNEYENLSNFIIEEVKNEDIDDLENLSNKVNKFLELIHDLENEGKSLELICYDLCLKYLQNNTFTKSNKPKNC